MHLTIFEKGYVTISEFATHICVDVQLTFVNTLRVANPRCS